MTNGAQQGGKKGLHPLAWVAIGCGAIALIGFLIVAALGFFAVKKGKELVQEIEDNPAKIAEWVIEANPDLEVVEHDQDAGTFTVRQNSTGEVATFDYSEVEQGRFTFEGAEGKTTFGAGASDVPNWVLMHPDATNTEVSFAGSTPEGTSGSLVVTVAASPKKVVEFYRDMLEARDFTATAQMISQTGEEEVGGIVTAENEAEGRTLQINVGPNTSGGSEVVIIYGGPQ